MPLSKNYTKILNYYRKGLWNIQRVYNVVGKSTGITPEEYQLITGEVYVAPGEE